MQIHTYAKECDPIGLQGELAKGVFVDFRDEYDFTPLAYVVSSPDPGETALQLLIDAGADVNAAVDSGKNYPIGLAACSGNSNKVKLLLEYGASINFVARHNYTILVNVIYALNYKAELLGMVDFLVKNGAKTNGETTYGESPLSVASGFGLFDVIRYLLEVGESPDRLQWSDLMRAVALGTSDDVKKSIAAGCSLEERDLCDRTAWMLMPFIDDGEKARLLYSAGADIRVRSSSGTTTLMSCAARNNFKMLAYLIELGIEIDEVDDSLNTALMIAAQSDATECVRLLLEAGSNPGQTNKYKDNAMSLASNQEIIRLLMKTGEDIGDISTEMKRTLTGLKAGDTLHVTELEYRNGFCPRFGKANPQVMEVPFWKEMVRSGISAYGARIQFREAAEQNGPAWCFSRYGCSFTELPDGRFVQIGGEHEDFYDRDFCIYNEVIVHSSPGEFQIMGYPKDVFPPTDFHSATYLDGYVYIIGGLGYHGARLFGTTPCYRLSCKTWSMEEVQTIGEKPGWIYEHKCRFQDKSLIVSGGKICRFKDGKEEHDDNATTFKLDLLTMSWTRL